MTLPLKLGHLLTACLLMPALYAQVSVTTAQYNNLRTGANQA